MTAPVLDKPLMNLREAAERLFGDGGKVRALRTEIDKGNLIPVKIANTLYVTDEDLREFIERCREKPKDHTSTALKKKEHSSSETGKQPSAQDALSSKLNSLKKNLPPTSRKSGRQTPANTGKVISLSQRS